MTLEEFIIQTKTLEDFYGKEYNATQKQIMFDELKFYTPEKYDKAIRFMCKTNRYKPTLNELLEAMQHSGGQQELEKTPCEACHGTGYIVYHKIIDSRDYEYGCLCNCANAEGKEYDGTKIADKEHRSKYYLEKAENVFLGKDLTKEPSKPVEKDLNKMVGGLVKQMTIGE